MLFNSLQFQFVFLPLALAGFFLLGRWSRLWAALWLSAASLFFYGWWDPRFVWLLLASVGFNFVAGRLISASARTPAGVRSRVLLAAAVSANLLLLGYFKYAGFFAGTANGLLGTSLGFGRIVLPLGISFYTFTQLAFLADAREGRVGDYSFTHYLLFVTYFPHLIAGPILHHKQVIPQFLEEKTYRVDWRNMAAGLTFFVAGLAKKVLAADRLSAIANPVFSAAMQGARPTAVESWAGALAYTLQLYFDFSGYCDMAVGISLLFNVRLPFNFNSPYKAASIVDFWRRWHRTLAVFLRDYLYIPLGGNRRGSGRRYFNLMVTMLVGGLWHGAAWTFVAWGALHGIFLCANHGIRALCRRLGDPQAGFGRTWGLLGGAVTFLCVVVAWVFFRAGSFSAAGNILRGMAGGFGLRHANAAARRHDDWGALLPIAAGLAVVWLLPNTQEFMGCAGGAGQPEGGLARIAWAPTRRLTWAVLGIVFALCLLSLSPAGVSEFLYYQF